MPCETIYFSLSDPQEPTTVPPVEFHPQVGHASIAVSHQPAPSQGDAFEDAFAVTVFWSILLLIVATVLAVVGAVLWALGAAVWSGLCHAAGSLGMADATDSARRSMDEQSTSYLRSVTRTIFGR